MTDLLTGRIQLISSSIGTFRAALDAGKIRLLLTATKERLPYLPSSPDLGQGRRCPATS